MSDQLPLLQEHQSPNVQNSVPAAYNPSPDERKLLKQVEKMFRHNKNFRSNYDKHWLDYYKMFRGKQWKDERPSFKAAPVFNLIFQTIQGQVPILTDPKPRFEYKARDPNDREFADLLNDITEAEWISKNYAYGLSERLFESHMYGTAISRLDFDEDADHGMGGIVYDGVDVFYFYPDSDAKGIKSKCEVVQVAEPISLKIMRRDYPDKAKFLHDDILDNLDISKNDLQPVRRLSATNDRLLIDQSTYTADWDSKKVLRLTTYFMDYDFEEVEACDKDGNKYDPPLFEKKLLYPKMRKVVTACGVVLCDESNEYDDNEFPFQRLINYILPGEFWGESEIEQISGPQKMYNAVMGFVLDLLALMGNPIWIVDNDANIDTYNLVGKPGLVVEKTKGSEVRRESGVQLQPFVMQLADTIKGTLDQIAGSQDVSRGINPTGVTAAEAIARLQNAAQTRIRQKSKNLDAYLQDLGQQFASRVMQYYTAPRVFRLTDNAGAEKYFRAYFTKNEATGKTVAFVQKFNAETGLLDANYQQYELRAELDVTCDTGTSLTSTKDEVRKDLESLYDRGIIDAEEFLKRIDYPNYQDILQRMAQRQQQQPPAK